MDDDAYDDPRDALFREPWTEDEHARNRLWLGHGLVIAIVLALMTNAVSLERWAASRAPSWGIETLRLTSQVWAERMALAGFDAPRNWIEEHWTDAKRADWEDVAPD